MARAATEVSNKEGDGKEKGKGSKAMVTATKVAGKQRQQHGQWQQQRGGRQQRGQSQGRQGQ
jgi:hypothetical protein